MSSGDLFSELTPVGPPVKEVKEKSNKLSPFDFSGAICETKKDLIVDEDTEKQYSPFMVNRQLSYFQDTILFANEMNRHAHLDNKLQFDFLCLGIPKRRRFSKWAKEQKSEDVDLLIRVYQCSREKAKVDLALLTQDQIDAIRRRASTGGLG